MILAIAFVLWGIYYCKSREFLLQLCPILLGNNQLRESLYAHVTVLKVAAEENPNDAMHQDDFKKYLNYPKL